MGPCSDSITRGVRGLPGVCRTLLRSLAELERNACRFKDGACRAIRRFSAKRPEAGCCIELPASVLKRADPLIYCQTWLLARGLAVTWDNPDIAIFHNGVEVSPWDLTANTLYDVRIRVWNGSYDAPAIGLPVVLSYLSFGIGTVSHNVGTGVIDLGAKGSATAPAFASIPWRTPPTPGHYCLQARLQWADDANPDNNLGQKNTQVGHLHSPAIMHFEARNDAGYRRRMVFEVDTYRLPVMHPCKPTRTTPAGRRADSESRWREALDEQGYGRFPVGNGWRVAITPTEIDLAPGEQITVQVTAEPLDHGFQGQQPLNIHGFASRAGRPRVPVGGVTLLIGRG